MLSTSLQFTTHTIEIGFTNGMHEIGKISTVVQDDDGHVDSASLTYIVTCCHVQHHDASTTRDHTAFHHTSHSYRHSTQRWASSANNVCADGDPVAAAVVRES